MSQLRKIFAVDGSKLSLAGGIAVGGLLLVIWLAVAQLNEQRYLITVVFAVLTTALSDPGGSYLAPDAGHERLRHRRRAHDRVAFFVGTQAAGFVVLALFVVTLVAGLAVKFGLHRFSTGMLLNVWFVLAVGLPISLHTSRIHTHTWEQALAWLIGSAAWITLTLIVWLARKRKWSPAPIIDVPGEPGAAVELTPRSSAICTSARLGHRRLSRYRLRVARAQRRLDGDRHTHRYQAEHRAD